MSTLQHMETEKFQTIKKIPVIDHVLSDEAAGLTDVSTREKSDRVKN